MPSGSTHCLREQRSWFPPATPGAKLPKHLLLPWYFPFLCEVKAGLRWFSFTVLLKEGSCSSLGTDHLPLLVTPCREVGQGSADQDLAWTLEGYREGPLLDQDLSLPFVGFTEGFTWAASYHSHFWLKLPSEPVRWHPQEGTSRTLLMAGAPGVQKETVGKTQLTQDATSGNRWSCVCGLAEKRAYHMERENPGPSPALQLAN